MPRPRTVDDEQILQAAARAVGDIGPTRMTLADVGSRVGLSPATLLQRFGSKRGLLLALAASGSEGMPAAIRSACDGERVLESLVDVLAGFADTIERPAQFANHLSFLLLDLSDPDFQKLSTTFARRVESAVQDVLTQAVARGELASRTDTSQLAQLVHAVYNGTLVRWGMAPEGRPGTALRANLRAVLYDGDSPRRTQRRVPTRH